MKRYLEPGVWTEDDGSLHFSIPEILAANGVPHTAETEAIILAALQDAAAEMSNAVAIVQVDE